MRPVRAIALYLVFVFFGGALVAPWIYSAAQIAAAQFPSLTSLAAEPFPRYLNRCLLVLAVIGIRPFLRATDLYSWRAVGLGRRVDAAAQLGWGFTWGLVSLACVVALAVAFGARTISSSHGVGEVLLQVGKAGLAAALVAPLEEIIFRGALFGALRKTLHWSLALGVTSAVYALLHFFDRAEAPAQLGWDSGLVVLGRMVAGLANLERVIPGFFNLTLAGVILGLAYQRLGSLHFSIGLHAGWIFWIKSYGFLTDTADPGRVWLFGTSKLVNGWVAFLLLGALLAILSRVMVPEEPQTGWKERRLLS